MASPIAATIHKSSKDVDPGISFYNDSIDGCRILNIYPGLWTETPLAEGMIVVAINQTTISKNLHSADDVTKMVEDCVGSLTIKARFADEGSGPTSAPSIPPSSISSAPPSSVPTAPMAHSTYLSASTPNPSSSAPVVVDAVVIPDNTFVPTASQQPSTTTHVGNSISGNGATHPHHLVPNGGYWGKNKYTGDKTQCTALCCCLFLFGIGGLLVLCCPMDERPVYVVNGLVYDQTGRRLGTINEIQVLR